MKLHSILRTGGAAALSQCLVLASMPIASRLFDEAAFGMLGLLIALSNILSIIGHFGYCDAVIAAGDDEQADALTRLVFLFCAASVVPVVGASIVMIDLDLFGYGALPKWAALIVAVQVVAITLTFVLQMRAVAAQRYGVLAGSHLVLGGTRSGGQVLAGILFPSAFGLMCSEVASRCATAALLLLRSPRALFDYSGGLAPLMSVLRELAGYASLRAAATALNTINVALPTLIVSEHFDLDKVGAMTLALAALLMPLGFVQKSVGDVFTGTYIELLRTDRAAARGTIRMTFLALVAVGAAMGAVLFVAAETLFALVFGARWVLAGTTAQQLAPLVFVTMVTIPLSSSLNILRRADLVLLFSVIRFLALALTFVLVGSIGLGYLDTVRTMVAVLCVAYAIYAGIIFRVNADALRSPELAERR